jgi:hypothetical protein
VGRGRFVGRARRARDLEEIQRRFREVIPTLPEDDRRFLLEALTADASTRAYMIGSLDASGLAPATTELLFDAMADPVVWAWLVRLLSEPDRPGLDR